MWAVPVVALTPTFHDHLRLAQRIEEFAVEQFIPQFCSVIPSLRQASTTASPLPSSISMVRNCPMISSAVYRFRAMPPPFAGRKLNSRSGLVYRGQVNRAGHPQVDYINFSDETVTEFRWKKTYALVDGQSADAVKGMWM
jgi:hypothetical protein